MDQRAGVWRPGAFVWRENATTDLAATTAFYEALLGWTHHDSEGGPMGIYRHFQVGGVDIAGCYELGAHMPGVPAHWIHYLSVEDVDAAAAAAQALGAQVHMGPMDIPRVGRAAYVQDPYGAQVALFRDFKGDAAQRVPPYAQGEICWETLSTTDKAGSVAFYGRVAGHHAVDFGGNVMLASGPRPEDGVADVEDAPPGAPSHWMSHVVVEDLAVAQARAVALGATVLVSGIVVPEVGAMTIIQDPVGCVISLYQPASR